jgi:hypothetical protein
MLGELSNFLTAYGGGFDTCGPVTGRGEKYAISSLTIANGYDMGLFWKAVKFRGQEGIGFRAVPIVHTSVHTVPKNGRLILRRGGLWGKHRLGIVVVGCWRHYCIALDIITENNGFTRRGYP